MDSVLFDGRQHYLKLATGEVLSLTAELGKTPAALADKTYAPARLAQLVLANLERRIFSVSAALRAKLQKLANRAAPPAHLQSESDIIMATSKKAPSKSPASKKAAPAKVASKKAAPVKASKAAPTKAAKAAPEAVAARAAKLPGDAVLTVAATTNPKRGAAADRFALYETGMTVAEYVAAGGKRADVAWDAKQGHITVAV